MKETIEQVLMIFIAIVTGVLSALHTLGLLHIPVLEKLTPALTLVVAGLIAGRLLVERRGKLDKIERRISEGVENTIAALKGAEVKRLPNKEELFKYYRRRIHEARHTVDDLSWGPVDTGYGTPAASVAFERYMDEIPKVCRKTNFVYREVMTFPSKYRVDRAVEMIERKLPCYHTKYYDIPHEGMPPFFQFLVIDSEEVIFAFHRYPYQPNEGGLHLSVKHPDIVKVFQDYYNSIWLGATVLKEGPRINRDELRKIQQQLISHAEMQVAI